MLYKIISCENNNYSLNAFLKAVLFATFLSSLLMELWFKKMSHWLKHWFGLKMFFVFIDFVQIQETVRMAVKFKTGFTCLSL